MPISFPIKPKTQFFQKVGQFLSRSLIFIRPDVVLAVMLITSIILTFLEVSAIGFYFLCGIFIICYFAERIAIRVWKKKPIKIKNKTEESKS